MLNVSSENSFKTGYNDRLKIMMTSLNKNLVTPVTPFSTIPYDTIFNDPLKWTKYLNSQSQHSPVVWNFKEITPTFN